MKKITLLLVIFGVSFSSMTAQHSVARDWNENLLDAIRSDVPRPTVHARNLFHSSVLMYDAWAIFDAQAETVFLGKTFRGFTCPFNGIANPADVDLARHQIISYAMYRLLYHRFTGSPGGAPLLQEFDNQMDTYGYDKNFTSIDYSTGDYRALGNYMASEMIAFGLQDGSNEQNDYANQYYTPVNEPLIMETGYYTDTNDLNDPNHWQPLAFDTFIDQNGHVSPTGTPPFVNPEWGAVTPFALKNEDLQILNNGFDSYVYNDPGPPAYIQNSNEDGIDDEYKWTFSLVASWSSQLDPNDPTEIDISPASIGNVAFEDFPQTFEEYKAFYDFTNGGDSGTGYTENPVTHQPYTPQIVKRADYARVLAEFWADGPNSETPPGHWFTIMNYVSDHPLVEKRLGGQGPILSDLEWDVKCYLALAGAVHDCAVDIWGIKGYYDYIRPVSAIRYMAGKGQSTDNTTPEGIASYDPQGIPLIPNLFEIIKTGDPLAGTGDENVGKIKLRAWKGPDFINDPDTDIAHVDWIIATHWWPYQRPTFVTPPFAGYLSGHSGFSRAAAETLTLLTGSPYFPGGMGTFDVTQNQFLVFEEGPTQDMTLQWASYKDASDQCSLSRIWGGIHPPMDDIRGRIIGHKIGIEAYNLALQYFNGTLSNSEVALADDAPLLYPVPFTDEFTVKTKNNNASKFQLFSLDGKLILEQNLNANNINTIHASKLASGLYFAKISDKNNTLITTKKLMKK